MVKAEVPVLLCLILTEAKNPFPLKDLLGFCFLPQDSSDPSLLDLKTPKQDNLLHVCAFYT